MGSFSSSPSLLVLVLVHQACNLAEERISDLALATFMDGLSGDERGRYARHLMLPEVGEEGQLCLKESKVCIIGAGGLGSPAILYLSAAGIGTIGIVDDDLVDASNLQRQIVHSNDTIGESKTGSAAKRITGLNPGVSVIEHGVRLSSENALEILDGYDVVVDGTDNIPARYLIGDACEILGIPWVYGSIFRFEGQITTFNHEGGPNYRDLHPEAPPPEAVPSCAEAGVIGVLPGVVGSIQATEAIKLLLGLGETLSGRLLLYDAKSMDFRTLRIGNYPERAKVTKLSDLQDYCEAGSATDESEEVFGIGGAKNMRPAEYKAKHDEGWQPFFLDVRRPAEEQIVSLPGTDLRIEHTEVLSRIDEIPQDREVVVYCRSGQRSMLVARALIQSGFKLPVYNLAGGVLAWVDEVDSSLPKY